MGEEAEARRCDVPSVGRNRGDPEQDGAVFREQIRVDQHPGLGVERRLPVEHGMILRPVTPVEEVFTACLERHRIGDAIRQLRQASLEPLPDGDLLQKPVRQLVLRLDPLQHLRRVHLLQPPVGVGDGRAVIVIDDIHGRRARIRERDGRRSRLSRGCRRQLQCPNRRQQGDGQSKRRPGSDSMVVFHGSSPTW
jgi:hypothetical protein